MYKTYVTDAYYIFNDGCYEWATDVDKTVPEFTSKMVEEHETLAEALESASEWGSKWAMYPSMVIENEEGEEVYISYASVTRCECCKRESFEQIDTDLRSYKKKDGSIMFPDIQ